jgi:hypothetical protein
VRSEKARAAAAGGTRSAAIDIDAGGQRGGVPMRLVGHFESRDKRFYQVIVMGPTQHVANEQVQMFMSSFKLL